MTNSITEDELRRRFEEKLAEGSALPDTIPHIRVDLAKLVFQYGVPKETSVSFLSSSVRYMWDKLEMSCPHEPH